MKYKIELMFLDKNTADRMREKIQETTLYNSTNIISLSKVKEVCDECSKKYELRKP